MKKIFILISACVLILLVGIIVTSDNSKNMGSVVISIPAFSNGKAIPIRYTCDGEGINPEILIEGAPEDAQSLALIIDDPDAPGGTFTHWLVWNIDPQTKIIAENSLPSGGELGTNSSGGLGYVPPCPPSGSHRYFFKLYALDAKLNILPGESKDGVMKAMEGHIISQAEIMGTYARI